VGSIISDDPGAVLGAIAPPRASVAAVGVTDRR
jgi:hypothetical protein